MMSEMLAQESSVVADPRSSVDAGGIRGVSRVSRIRRSSVRVWGVSVWGGTVSQWGTNNTAISCVHCLAFLALSGNSSEGGGDDGENNNQLKEVGISLIISLVCKHFVDSYCLEHFEFLSFAW